MNFDHPLIRRGFDSIPLGGYAYVATPYSLCEHQWAVERASWWQAQLAARYRVASISPVVMGHYMEPHLSGWSHSDWLQWCYPMLDKARCVVVPPISGWDKSVGIEAEVSRALGMNMVVVLG